MSKNAMCAEDPSAPHIVHVETDNVNNPEHYRSDKFVTIDVIRDMLGDDRFEGFCIGNVAKYIWRYRKKGGTEDLKKARWYLNKAIEVRENGLSE